MKNLIKNSRTQMEERLDYLKGEYNRIRAGRANPAVLDKIIVDYYGTPTPINQMAAVSVAEARILVIQPWDASSLKEIEKAIQASDLGINPQNDGKIIRIIFPALTEDRRKEINKDISKFAEETKVQVRNIRREAMESLRDIKNSGDVSEDAIKLEEENVQELTDEFTKEIDKISESKQKEILEI